MAHKKNDIGTVSGKYINPFTDFGFKKLFGEEPNKDLLIDFVNQLLLEQNISIKTLSYKKNEHLGKTDLDRKVVFDLYCENEKGEKFIVEMQKAKQKYFKDRTLYYSTFPIQEQGVKSSDWNYKLQSVFAIAILDFTFDDQDANNMVVTRAQIIDNKTQKVFYDKLTFIFVQMPVFDKSIEQLETRLDKWLYVLKNLDKFDRIPERIKDKIFEKVFKISEYQKLSEEERQAYEDSLKYYRDLKNSMDTAQEEGAKLAEERLLPIIEEERRLKEEERRLKEEAKLREEEERRLKEEERRLKEEAQLREEEANSKIIKLAKMLKEMNVSMAEMMEKTGLSKHEIEKL